MPFCCCVSIPPKRQLKRERLILAHDANVYSIVVVKDGGGDLKQLVTVNSTPTVNSRETSLLCMFNARLSSVSSLIQYRTSSVGNGVPHTGLGLPALN